MAPAVTSSPRIPWGEATAVCPGFSGLVWLKRQKPSLPWLRPKGPSWGGGDSEVQQGAQEAGPRAQRPRDSASHLCMGSFHGLKTRGPTVVGSHTFSCHGGIDSHWSLSDRSVVHHCSQGCGAQIGSSQAPPSESWPGVATGSSKTMGTPRTLL